MCACLYRISQNNIFLGKLLSKLKWPVLNFQSQVSVYNPLILSNSVTLDVQEKLNRESPAENVLPVNRRQYYFKIYPSLSLALRIREASFFSVTFPPARSNKSVSLSALMYSSFLPQRRSSSMRSFIFWPISTVN